MEQSILKSTKKVLGIDPAYEAFDQDILTHINSTFSILKQLGIGPTSAFSIDDDAPVWSAFTVSAEQLGLVKTYVYLRVRMLFDPPATGYHIDALKQEIAEHEWRLVEFQEEPAGQLLVDAKILAQTNAREVNCD